jgi:spermidine synthase
LFTPALGTVVYAFASLLGLYLGATYVGSLIYRRGKFCAAKSSNFFLASLGLFVLLPLLACDPRIPLLNRLRVAGILPFSLAVGFLTPMVLDQVSQGDPDRAGRGYAINILGCVLGPLASGFLLLPVLGERFTLLALAVPWLAVSFRGAEAPDLAKPRAGPLLRTLLAGLLSLLLVVATNDFESQFVPREVRRDSTATVTAGGANRIEKVLLVNGIGMAGLTPITKMIAHLPLAFLSRPPKNALVICFGMGTIHRSAVSWGVQSTAVELVPSVVSVFPYFHADANQVLGSPLSKVVIDDGRFFMERSNDRYDVIAIDPPPPVEAAGSSLLYSKEFYSIAKLHLAPDGIL